MPRKYQASKQTLASLSSSVFGVKFKLNIDEGIQGELEDILGACIEDDYLSRFEKVVLDYDDSSASDKERIRDQFFVDITRETIENTGISLNNYEKFKRKEELKPKVKEIEQSVLEIMQAVKTVSRLMDNRYDTITTATIRNALKEEDISFKSYHQESVKFLKPLEKALSKVYLSLKGTCERGKSNKIYEKFLIRELSGIYKQHISKRKNLIKEPEENHEDMENEYIREVLVYYNIPISTTNKSLNQVKKNSQVTCK